MYVCIMYIISSVWVGGGGGIVFYDTLINFASIISVCGQIDLAL